MIGAAGKAQRMRHDQADKTHAAGTGDGAGREQAGTEEQAFAQRAHAHAQRAGRFRVQGHDVQRARAAQRKDQGAGQDQPGHQPRGRAGQVADHPEHHAAQAALRGNRQHQGDDGHAGRGQDHARQQQERGAAFGSRAAAQVAAGKEIQQHRYADGAGKGGRVDHPQRAHEQQRGQRADGSAGGNAQHVRVGQGIAQQRLHHDAGQGERRAGDERGQRAAQAQVEQGGGEGVALALHHMEQGGRQVGERNCDRTDHAGENQAGNCAHDQHREDHGGAVAHVAEKWVHVLP